jgi:hypothetical protein
MSATAKRPATVSCSFTRRGRPEVLWLVFIIVTAILIRETMVKVNLHPESRRLGLLVV